AHVAPVAMVFARSKDGRSHTPAEFTSIGDAVEATRVLAAALYQLAYWANADASRASASAEMREPSISTSLTSSSASRAGRIVDAVVSGRRWQPVHIPVTRSLT